MTNELDRTNQLRAKVRDGEELTLEEAHEALDLLRARRKEAAEIQTKKESKKPPINLNDLFV